ncbi:unannotated protein [freshwater metagenome]|uniref:Unannotated protein n=1 Tax=freshwater metagenome TaxID=449393 RepID=A0A6J7EQM1_9ZZZZ
MKQNSQWLSQVRTWSNSALSTSAPSGSPARLATSTVRVSPPRRTSISRSGSSTSIRHSMMSRGTWPLRLWTSSPVTRPAAAAGEPGAMEVTIGADMALQATGGTWQECL